MRARRAAPPQPPLPLPRRRRSRDALQRRVRHAPRLPAGPPAPATPGLPARRAQVPAVHSRLPACRRPADVPGAAVPGAGAGLPAGEAGGAAGGGVPPRGVQGNGDGGKQGDWREAGSHLPACLGPARLTAAAVACSSHLTSPHLLADTLALCASSSACRAIACSLRRHLPPHAQPHMCTPPPPVMHTRPPSLPTGRRLPK